MLTRKQRTARSNSNISSNADDDESDDNAYDFMDGKLTKQTKAKQRQAATMKAPPARRQVVKQDQSLNDSKASAESKSSTMRTRSARRVKQ